MPLLNIGIVGASGAVGKEILRLLEKRAFQVNSLKCFGSERSAGSVISFQGEDLLIEKLAPTSFKGLDIVFFSAGSKVSKEYAPIAQAQGALVIDNSSAFRHDPTIPLIIPEVNSDALQNHQGLIANPNCATILLLLVLAPLHNVAKLKRIVVSTYQAASGAGELAMQDLIEETRALLENRPYERKVIPHPYAFNLFLHNSPLKEDYSEEELKLVYETRKILNDQTIQVGATCVRVPVLRSHSESVNAEFHTPISKDDAYTLLAKAPGVQILEDWVQNRFPMPQDATGLDNVLCGRIREDMSQKNTLDLWIVGDQLIKGAALNAIQIAEVIQNEQKTRKPTLSTL